MSMSHLIKKSIADYAKNNNWLIVKVNDIPDPSFPMVSSSVWKEA